MRPVFFHPGGDTGRTLRDEYLGKCRSSMSDVWAMRGGSQDFRPGFALLILIALLFQEHSGAKALTHISSALNVKTASSNHLLAGCHRATFRPFSSLGIPPEAYGNVNELLEVHKTSGSHRVELT